MHVCIIGTGASGWITCTLLRKVDFIKKITIIGCSKIPSIGVGESTTLSFVSSFLNDVDLKKFVQESDASVKYGVYYKNWSKRDFIHPFKSQNPFLRLGCTELTWGESLSNKNTNTHIHDIVANRLWNFIQKNEVSLDNVENPHSWHFDAGKFIQFLKKVNLEDEKVSLIEDKIVDSKFLFKDTIQYIVGQSNVNYTADYFVNCCGNNDTNIKVFKEDYTSLSQYLLTNKALVCPLKYNNIREEIHPYTVAKTMNTGWRWITPTQSRIGTGYVFSDNHISVDEATSEFLKDIGDISLNPSLVDIAPKLNNKPFKSNNCAIGMSSGFLEPLDAPGLSLSIHGVELLIQLLEYKKDSKSLIRYFNFLNTSNDMMKKQHEWWCSFILNQYKTCWRNDTQFWLDHKSVECDFYNQIINSLYCVPPGLFERHEYMMFYFTIAAKDIKWKSKITQKPFPTEELDTKTIHHLDYIKSFYD
jgi:tryptophan halogenase